LTAKAGTGFLTKAMKNIWKSPAAGVAAIFMVTLLVYIPAMRGGFVFDDDSLIIHNRLIHAGDGLYRFWFTTESPDCADANYNLGNALRISRGFSVRYGWRRMR
jgi:hypothetical protein